MINWFWWRKMSTTSKAELEQRYRNLVESSRLEALVDNDNDNFHNNQPKNTNTLYQFKVKIDDCCKNSTCFKCLDKKAKNQIESEEARYINSKSIMYHQEAPPPVYENLKIPPRLPARVAPLNSNSNYPHHSQQQQTRIFHNHQITLPLKPRFHVPHLPTHPTLNHPLPGPSVYTSQNSLHLYENFPPSYDQAVVVNGGASNYSQYSSNSQQTQNGFSDKHSSRLPVKISSHNFRVHTMQNMNRMPITKPPRSSQSEPPNHHYHHPQVRMPQFRPLNQLMTAQQMPRLRCNKVFPIAEQRHLQLRALSPPSLPVPVTEALKLRHPLMASAKPMANKMLEIAAPTNAQHLNQIVRAKKKELAMKMPNHQLHLMVQKNNHKDLLSRQRKYKTLAVLLFIFAILSAIMFDPIVDFVLNWQFQLQDGNILTMIWKNTPMIIGVDFYLFSLRNGPEFINGAKPNVAEIGPFSYKIGRVRKVGKRTADTVTFTEQFLIEHDPSKSMSLDTPITVINYPIVGASLFARNLMKRMHIVFLSPIVNNIIVSALRVFGENVVDNLTAGDLLEGHAMRILDFIDYFVKPMKAAGLPIPEYKLGNYGLDDTLNIGLVPLARGSVFGPTEVYSRNENGHIMGDVVLSNGRTRNDRTKPPCDKVSGTDPLFFGINLDAPTISIFYGILCRKLQFFRNQTHYVGGVQATRYIFPTTMYDMTRKENHCYCFDRSLSECDGWFSIEGCMFGVPVGISFPHFLGSRRRQSEVDGLEPQQKKHEAYLDLWTRVGVPFNVKLGIQANLEILPLFGVTQLSRLPKTVLPIGWVSINLGAHSFYHLDILLFVAANFIRVGPYLLFLGAIFASAFCFYKFRMLRNKV